MLDRFLRPVSSILDSVFKGGFLTCMVGQIIQIYLRLGKKVICEFAGRAFAKWSTGSNRVFLGQYCPMKEAEGLWVRSICTKAGETYSPLLCSWSADGRLSSGEAGFNNR